MKAIKHIIKYDSCECEGDCVMLWDCELLQDFGESKAGEKFEVIEFDIFESAFAMQRDGDVVDEVVVHCVEGEYK